MTGPESLQDLTDGRLSQLKMLAERQGWDEIVHDIKDEQQKRLPGPEP